MILWQLLLLTAIYGFMPIKSASPPKKCGTCDKTLPKLIEPRAGIDDPVTTSAPITTDACMTKIATCKNTATDSEGVAWLMFNQKEARVIHDEGNLAPCYQDKVKCEVTLTCNGDGKWTTAAKNGKTAIVETLFCA